MDIPIITIRSDPRIVTQTQTRRCLHRGSRYTLIAAPDDIRIWVCRCDATSWKKEL